MKSSKLKEVIKLDAKAARLRHSLKILSNMPHKEEFRAAAQVTIRPSYAPVYLELTYEELYTIAKSRLAEINAKLEELGVEFD